MHIYYEISKKPDFTKKFNLSRLEARLLSISKLKKKMFLVFFHQMEAYQGAPQEFFFFNFLSNVLKQYKIIFLNFYRSIDYGKSTHFFIFIFVVIYLFCLFFITFHLFVFFSSILPKNSAFNSYCTSLSR